MSTSAPGSHFSTLPPSTRGILASSASSSTTSTPTSPLSTSSAASGAGIHFSNGTPSGSGSGSSNRNDRTKDDYGGSERIQAVRPGTSLVNMNTSTTVSPSADKPGSSKIATKSIEHLGSHEHLTYSNADDLDELSSPGGSNYGSASYRQYQQHTGVYGSPRATSAQLRANRAAAGGQLDIFSSGSGSGGGGQLHALHSKGSNISTSTFIASSPRDREREKTEPLPSSSHINSGPATPTPGNMTPYTPSLPQHTPGQSTSSTSSTPVMSSSMSHRNKASAPSTPASSISHLPPHTPQGGSSTPVSATPAGMVNAPAHPAVTRTKSGLSNVTPGSAGGSGGGASSHRSGGSRRGTVGREREREGDPTTPHSSSSRRAKIRITPHLPTGLPMEMAPPTLMYWSRAPVYGHLPTRSMRAHSVTLVDNTAWLFGGCDERGCARDVWCCDVETFQWSQPQLVGDIPPPCRAHTATLVDGKRIFIFGGGEGPTYYNSLYILDTQSKRFIRVPCGQPSPTTTTATAQPESGTNGKTSPTSSMRTATLPATASGSSSTAPATPAPNGSFTPSGPSSGTITSKPQDAPPPMPLPRRAHTTVLYKHKLYIFGGGNGVKALNDVWSLDTSVSVEKMRWEKVVTVGARPGPRGYHTANLVGNIMIVVGGSDGRDCFADIWVLNLDTLVWTQVETDKEYKRLSHTSTQVGSYLFIMGGHDGLKYSSELLLFNLVTLQFEHKQTMGRPPPARGYHISLLGDARLLVFGGFDGHSVYDDVWILDLAGAAYLPQVTSFALLIDQGQ